MESAISGSESTITGQGDPIDASSIQNAAKGLEMPLLVDFINNFAAVLNAYERNGLIDDSILRDWTLDHVYTGEDGCYYADEDLIAHARRSSMNIPKDLIHCNFGNFEGPTSEHKFIGREVMDWVTSWKRDCHKHSLLIIGPTGTGKSHLAVSSLKRMVSFNLSPFYVDYRAMLTHLMAGGWDSDPVGDYADKDLLLIDDFGSRSTSTAQGDKVATVIAMRNSERRPTIITTNDSLKIDKYKGMQSNEKFLDARLVSRMGYSYKFINTGQLYDWRAGNR